MTKQQQLLVAVSGTVLVGVAVTEHMYRLAAERRFQASVGERQRLELQYAEAFASHEQLTRQLQEEQSRSKDLAQALAEKHAALEEAVGRLTKEMETIQELNTRLVAMEQQMEQLQGELSAALLEREGKASTAGTNAIQLERIVVTDANAIGQQGRVISVHPEWRFVVMDLGWNDVKIGDMVSIFRNDHLLAKARVERVQERVAAATLLPEWQGVEVHVNDVVRLL